MWLLAGQKAPDHSTIARFRTGFLADACENLFYQTVKRMEKIRREMGNKNVPEDTGGSFAFKSGIHTNLEKDGRKTWIPLSQCNGRFRI